MTPDEPQTRMTDESLADLIKHVRHMKANFPYAHLTDMVACRALPLLEELAELRAARTRSVEPPPTPEVENSGDSIDGLDITNWLRDDWRGADRPRYRLKAAEVIERLRDVIFQHDDPVEPPREMVERARKWLGSTLFSSDETANAESLAALLTLVRSQAMEECRKARRD